MRSGDNAEGATPPQPFGQPGVAAACRVARRHRPLRSPPPRSLSAARKTRRRGPSQYSDRLLEELLGGAVEQQRAAHDDPLSFRDPGDDLHAPIDGPADDDRPPLEGDVVLLDVDDRLLA